MTAPLPLVIVDNVDGFPAWLMFMPVLQRRAFGLGPWDRYQRAVGRLKALLLDEIANARRDSSERQDVLALLVGARDERGDGMSDDELCGELRTLLIAGHETTSTTLIGALKAYGGLLSDAIIRSSNRSST